MFLNHLPTSECFITFFILLPLTPCAISDSYCFLHQKLVHPQISKFQSLLYHVKKLHVDLSKFWLREAQKWCRIFFLKRRCKWYFACWKSCQANFESDANLLPLEYNFLGNEIFLLRNEIFIEKWDFYWEMRFLFENKIFIEENEILLRNEIFFQIMSTKMRKINVLFFAS